MSHFLRRLKYAARLFSALLVTCLLSVLAPAPLAQADSVTFTVAGSGAWIAPEGVIAIAIECWGGGGGGGTDYTSVIGGGGGGGGGAYARVNTFAVTPGSSYAYVVGAGGGADTGGEASSFNGTTCVAAGGGAGGSGNPGSGGAGGAAAASSGDVVFAGGSGSIGLVISGGGGGGSAGSESAGAAAANTITGAAVVTGGGPGGNGGAGAAGFPPAAGPGGGGGGGEYIGSGSGGIRNGGAGYAGQIRITLKVIPTLAVTGLPATYNGAPQEASLSASAAATAVAGTPSNIKYNGSPTVPTDAGAYAVTADFTPADPITYIAIANEPAGDFVIAKAPTAAAVTCDTGPFTYTGATIEPCTASVTGVNGLDQTLVVSYIANTNAGTATASAGFAESTNHLASSASKNFTIGQATPTLAVTNSPAAYDGTPHTADVKGSVAGAVTNIKYNGATTVPADAGIYAVTADFTPGNANYKTLTAAPAGSFVIAKAGLPVLTVTNPTVIYTGAPQAASLSASAAAQAVAGTPGNVKYNGSTTVPVAAGVYLVTADFTPDDVANYDNLSEAPAGTFTIAKAPTTTMVTCDAGPFTYTGAAIEPCTARVTGAGGLNDALAVSYAGNVNVGTAMASAGYTGSPNYLASSDSEVFIIGEAPTVILHLPFAAK